MQKWVLIFIAALAAACANTPEQQAANDARSANDAVDPECPVGTKLVDLRDRLYCVDPDRLQEEIERAWDHREDW